MCVHANALHDDDDVHEPIHWMLGLAAADIPGNVLVDVVPERSAHPVERKRVQKQPHEQGQVLIEEHFPETPGFLEQMELRQTVEFPEPWEAVAGTATALALPAFLAKENQALQHHSHQ